MVPAKISTPKKSRSFFAAVQALVDVWRHLSGDKKRQAFFLAILMLVGGFSEAVSLGAVLPFLAAIAAPETFMNSAALQKLTGFLQNIGFLPMGTGSEPLLGIVSLFALFLIVAALFSGGVRLLLIWQSARLANLAGAEISVELYRRILSRPYIRFIQENSATMISNIAAKNGQVVLSMTALLNLVVSVVIASFIFLTLLWIEPLITALASFLIGSLYGVFLAWSRGCIQAKSAEISSQQDAIFLKLQEGLGGIRDIILDGVQDTYSGIFKQSIYPLRLAFAKVTFLSQYPRSVVESFTIILFVGLAWWAHISGSGAAGLIPYLGALALGITRLLPNLQQGYAAWSTILGYEVVTQDALRILSEPPPDHARQDRAPRMALRHEVRLEAVKFRYLEQGPWVLDGISLTIPKGSRIGFIGKTGSGKSTCLDLLMGLLPPTEGRILIDGRSLDPGNLRSWQKNIAHVPQSIFLSDSNFAENIAFGIARVDIDMNRVKEAARQAQIAEFIESTPKGYQEPVGERGIRLSGGQRQRIGIARALYKESDVLVLDEATSALDGETETTVMESIGKLGRHLTILMIAHRITSLRNCDQIFCLKNGKAEIVHGLAAELVPTP